MNTTDKTIRVFSNKEKAYYNKYAIHPIQSWEWGEFKEQSGFKVIRFGEYKNNQLINVFQITYRSIPFINKTIGFLSNCPLPSEEVIQFVENFNKENNAIYTKIEPKFIITEWQNIKGEIQEEPLNKKDFSFNHKNIANSDPIFDQYTTIIDLAKSEEDILQQMHHKTRYNIRVAIKKGVKVIEDSTLEGMKSFLALNKETTKRQNFYLHNDDYFLRLFKTFETSGGIKILKAQYNGIDLAVWILFIWNNKLYYPYGASSNKYRELMASNLIAWESIKLGKKLGAKEFDLWGCLNPNTDINHKWYGFHKFKLGLGANIYQYAGSWDLISSRLFYNLYLIAFKIRAIFLSIRH